MKMKIYFQRITYYHGVEHLCACVASNSRQPLRLALNTATRYSWGPRSFSNSLSMWSCRLIALQKSSIMLLRSSNFVTFYALNIEVEIGNKEAMNGKFDDNQWIWIAVSISIQKFTIHQVSMIGRIFNFLVRFVPQAHFSTLCRSRKLFFLATHPKLRFKRV